MIKVISGTIIYNDGSVTKSYTPADDPFEAAPELEKRWVSEGFAQFAGPSLPAAKTGNKEVDDFLNGKTEKLPEGTEEIPEEEAQKLQAEAEADSLETFTKAQLIEKFNDLGLEGNPNRMNKAQLIEAIENAPVDEEAAEDEAPDFGDEDGVVE